MKENLEFALKCVALSEGGYVNNPRDPGGPTDRGITQRTFDAYNERKGLPKKPVRGISKELADRIIADNYFRPIRFDDLPAGLDYSVADFAVNSGVRRAVIELQKIVGVKQDGVIGDLTLAALEHFKPLELIIAYNAARMKFLKGLSTWADFKNGWTRRVEGEIAGAQEGDIGVVDRSLKLSTLALRGGRAQAPDDDGHGTSVPVPTVATPGRGIEEDRSGSTILGKVLADPVAAIPAIGTVLAPLLNGLGPVQWALAGLIILGGVYALVRALKRSA